MTVALAEQPTVCNNPQQPLSCRSNIKDSTKTASPVGREKYSVVDNSDVEEKRVTVRKGLGCRRSAKDMLSSEEQKEIAKNDRKQNEKGSQRRPLAGKGRSSRVAKPRRRLIFTSPRLTASDEELFPSDHSLYKESSDRWEQISNQAGSHRQDGTVMNIGRRPSTANVFRKGMLSCAAVRVRSLNLWVDHEKDTILEWLEMIKETFPNLEHLTLTQDLFPGEDDMAVSARMRRLYVLSILPNLKSVDDMIVTPKEREMANPGHYNGQVDTKEDMILSPSNESIGTNASDPVLIEADSVRTCRANGIEVEFLSEKCWEVKQTETDTTASSSPTSSVEDRITDENSELDLQDGLTGISVSNDTSTVTEVPSIGTDHSSSREGQDQTCDEALEECSSSTEMNAGSIPEICQCTSNGDRFRSSIRALDNGANDSIELVPVICIDSVESTVCDVSDSQKNMTHTFGVQLSLKTEDEKEKTGSFSTLAKIDESKAISCRDLEQPKNSSNGKPSISNACTPVQRQSKVIVPTPQFGCCQILTEDPCEISQFSFPTSSRAIPKNKPFTLPKDKRSALTANQRLPPPNCHAQS